MNGWFRTGDQGLLDDSGYLWLTGRLKEIINRGGEKISPLEVDEVPDGTPRCRSGGHISPFPMPRSAKRLPLPSCHETGKIPRKRRCDPLRGLAWLPSKFPAR